MTMKLVVTLWMFAARGMAATIAVTMALMMLTASDVAAQTAPLTGEALPGAVNTRERPMVGLTSPGEADLLRALKGVQGQVTIPDQKLAVLIQPQGRDWRDTTKGPIRVIGAWLILGMVLALILFYVFRGRIMISAGPAGRVIQRFGASERFIHWFVASSFVVLALTGLNVTFGRYVLLPILGPELFTSLSIALKYAHNFAAFPFMIGIVLMFFIWVAHNIPNHHDLQWLAVAGGLFSTKQHPPSRKFNAGQKVVFWSVILGGAVISFSGIFLLFPFYFGDVHAQQLMQVLHSIFSLILIAIIIAHIYIGSLGMEGAWDAMGTGYVDENWARDHHNIWVAEMRGEPAPKLGHD